MSKKGLFLCGALLSTMCWADRDPEGSKDHPLMSRYPGSTILRQVVADFDAYSFAVSAPGKDEASFNQVKKIDVEGKLTRTSYDMPKSASLLAVFRSYEQALNKAGFAIVFQCKKEQCGSSRYWEKMHLGTAARFDTHQYYLAAKKGQDKSATYIVVHATQNGDGGFIHSEVDVLEEKGLQDDLITTSAASLESAIASTGKALVYDLYFDTAKAELKAESQPAIEAIAQFLKASKFKLYVVGHTDGVGTLSSNLDLSKRRADAIVSALTSKGIAKDRLVAQGVGPLAPVASNTDDLGRGKNRRVELVPMI